jgi:hypothetical protein
VTTVAELDRETKLVADLQALGNVQPGDVIRAVQWNALVSNIVSLAQAVMTTQSDTSVPPHEHPDQVKLSWLDPSVRTFVEHGPLADPAGVVRLTDLDQRVKQLATDVDGIKQAVASLRDRVAELSTNELGRDSKLTEIGRVVTSIDQRKDAILEVRQTLATVQTKVDQAVAASAKLTIDGQPADLNALNQRVRTVEDLAGHLKLSNGQVLDGATFEGRLLQLRNDVVTQAQLDAAVKLKVTEVPKETLDTLQLGVTNALRGEFNISFGQLKTDIAAEADRKLSTVDATVGKRLDDRLPGAIDAAISGVKALVNTTAEQLRKDARDLAGAAAKDASAAVSKDLGGRIDDLRGTITTNVKSVLDTELPPRLDKLTSSLAAAQGDFAAATAQIKVLGDGLQAVRTDVAANAIKTDTALKSARTDLIAEMDKRGAAATQKSAGDIKDLETRLNSHIDDRTIVRLNELNVSNQALMAQTATDAANAAVKSSSVQLRSEMTTIAKDQALALQDQVRAAVKADLEPVINERIATAVKKTPIAVIGTHQ